jgi:hypothetical protein
MEAWTSLTWPIRSMTLRSPPSVVFRAWAVSSTPHLDPLPILPLYGSIEGEERRPRVLPVSPPEGWPLPRMQATVCTNQSPG